VRGGRGTVSVTPQIFTCIDVISRPNKKLRYREEHSASIVLSWCTLWHLSGSNLLLANQALFCS